MTRRTYRSADTGTFWVVPSTSDGPDIYLETVFRVLGSGICVLSSEFWVLFHVEEGGGINVTTLLW